LCARDPAAGKGPAIAERIAAWKAKPVPVDCGTGARAAVTAAPARRRTIRIGLLGLGQVGSAFAGLVQSRAGSFEITAALVRDAGSRPRRAGVPITASPTELFETRPDVVVEVLGDLEPARTLVLGAFDRGIPVVTANKSLLARHGDELIDAAADAGVPLCYEASVVAGVPFLGPLARRPVLASTFTGLTGIVNGTTNFVLSTMAATGADYEGALREACRRGFAEPDPSKDVTGVDALEKLIVLLRHVGRSSVDPASVELRGISDVTAADLRHARDLGGTIKPVIAARWSGAQDGPVEAFCGPAFVPAGHQLACLDGVANGVLLRDRADAAFLFAGPGAGPVVTATTLLDDVIEAATGSVSIPARAPRGRVEAPATPWFVQIPNAPAVPPLARLAEVIGGAGVQITRAANGEGGDAVSVLTSACSRGSIDAALAAIDAQWGSQATALRAIGDRP
jgi:homoserine dehydrogenase